MGAPGIGLASIFFQLASPDLDLGFVLHGGAGICDGLSDDHLARQQVGDAVSHVEEGIAQASIAIGAALRAVRMRLNFANMRERSSYALYVEAELTFFLLLTASIEEPNDIAVRTCR